MSVVKEGLEGRGFVESEEWVFREKTCKRTKGGCESALEDFVRSVSKNRKAESNGPNDPTLKDHSKDTLRDLPSLRA